MIISYFVFLVVVQLACCYEPHDKIEYYRNLFYPTSGRSNGNTRQYGPIVNNVMNKESKPSHNRVVACYFSSWATHRQGPGKFDIEDIDPSLCTHLIYAFAVLDSSTSTIKSHDPTTDLEENGGKGGYKKMTALRNKYPHLTVSLAIGGWSDGSAKYSRLAANANSRRIFVDSVISFLSKYNFNGFDLDWEYPTLEGGAPEDKSNFVALVRDLHAALKPKGWILTAALAAGKEKMESAYNLRELNQYLDFVHLMSYDYHGKWDQRTGANAPLHSQDFYNVAFSVDYMLRNGIEPRKLILGLHMYGKTYVLVDASRGDTLGAPSTATAFKGPYTAEDGMMNYFEIFTELNQGNWKRMWDSASLTPFARNGNKVISYDNEESLKHKVKFAMEKGLGGVMIWSIDGDVKGQFPLLTSVNQALASSR